ncbi:MAG: hypothetical protein K9W44_05775 [Candidatus Lokiarchaeota archaeon]|nr:hypothetical protein [Candidatus Harpocratesius repetitus]
MSKNRNNINIENISNFLSFFTHFLQFSGIIEMVIAVGFFFLPLVADSFGIDLGIPLFYLFAAVEFLTLGFLLWYAARDPKKYRIIIVSSCAFRFLMIIPELTTIILYPQFSLILFIGLAYDWISSIFTLISMKYLNFL